MAATSPDKSGQWSDKQRKTIFFVAFTVIILVLGYWNYKTFAAGFFEANPSSADCIAQVGEVIDMHSGGGSARKSRESYFVSYTYTAGGVQYEGKQRVDDNVYNRTKIGAEIEICAMKDNPERSAIIGNDIKGEDAFMVVLVDIGAVALLIFVIATGLREKKTKGVTA